jgi:hypothetical protein
MIRTVSGTNDTKTLATAKTGVFAFVIITGAMSSGTRSPGLM